jgi:ribonucleoside-diphosphate reductase alpha chain
MVMGLPYDSDGARAVTGALTAIMCGQAYVTSAEMAADKGPFPGYEPNREPTLKVMAMHRDAARQIDPVACPADLLAAAAEDWDRAVDLGKQHGYRNAQATVIAPTGTIGLLMDCDTTGIEPDFSLVKFKKLAGGGYFKIVNASVPSALRRLGYDEDQIKDIITFICGSLTLKDAPHVNAQALKEKGFTQADIKKVEGTLRGVFDLRFAFSPWNLGEKTMARLGFDAARAAEPGFDVLEALGFTQDQIDEANDVICGRMTIEGAPHIQEAHLPVFDCANQCGRHGKRFIAPQAHLKMMSAAQPFISGAISKTVNVPNETTAKEIEQLYVEGWRLGLKAVAIYRDGSKLSQPLSSSSTKKKADAKAEEAETPEASPDDAVVAVSPQAVRRRLPAKRSGFTQEARVAGHKVFLRTGEYEDGALGEIFIDMHKEGAPFRSMLNCFAIAVSKGLQHGVPLEEFVDTFTFTRFEPWGTVDHPNIKFATSIIDYVFRVLGYEYLGRTDFLQVKPEDLSIDTPTGEATSAKSAGEAGDGDAGAEDGSNASTQSGNGSAGDDEEPAGAAETAAAGGNGTGKRLPPTNGSSQRKAAPQAKAQTAVLDNQLSQMMGDAPFCDNCGHITVRNGSCYKCLNCGNSVGCS